MIDGSEKRSRQLAFELQNSHVGEKRSNRRRNMKIKENNTRIKKRDISDSSNTV